MKICADHIFDFLNLDKIDFTYKKESFPQYYVYKCILKSFDVLVGETDAEYKDHNEEQTKIDTLLTDKDFMGLAEYLSELSGKDYVAKYNKSYGSYDELTDTQKAFVDNFVAEKMNYRSLEWVYASDTFSGTLYRNTTFILTMPALDSKTYHDTLLTDWYEEHQVMDYTVHYDGIYGEYSYDDFAEFVWRYFTVIEYAKKNVE